MVSPHEHNRLDRRDLLRKAALGGGVAALAWMAPQLTGVASAGSDEVGGFVFSACSAPAGCYGAADLLDGSHFTWPAASGHEGNQAVYPGPCGDDTGVATQLGIAVAASQAEAQQLLGCGAVAITAAPALGGACSFWHCPEVE